MTSSIRLGLWNARSLKNKLNDIKILANEFDILCITETWLNSKYNAFNVKGFNVYRNDRDNNLRGGGVCVIINNKILHKLNTINCQEMKETESISITIFNAERETDIIVAYKKPDLKWDKQNWSNFLSNRRRDVDTIFMGDFNAKNPLWNCNSTNREGQILEDVLMETDLFIGNNDTTSRLGDERSSSSNIDLFITSMNIIGKSQYRSTGEQWGSDHFVLEMKLYDNIRLCNRKKTTRKTYNDTTMDWHKFRRIIETKLKRISNKETENTITIDQQTTQERYNTFETIINEAIAESQDEVSKKKNKHNEGNSRQKCNKNNSPNQDSKKVSQKYLNIDKKKSTVVEQRLLG